MRFRGLPFGYRSTVVGPVGNPMLKPYQRHHDVRGVDLGALRGRARGRVVHGSAHSDHCHRQFSLHTLSSPGLGLQSQVVLVARCACPHLEERTRADCLLRSRQGLSPSQGQDTSSFSFCIVHCDFLILKLRGCRLEIEKAV